MRKGDFLWIALILGVVAFLYFPATNKVFVATTAAHPFMMAFIKYFILATMGELLGRRIIFGKWSRPVGLLARMAVWGLIGMAIMFMFDIFAIGVKGILDKGLLPGNGINLWTALLTSSVSVYGFGPAFMLFHRFTDTYIDVRFGPEKRSASLKELIALIDWDNLVSFVYMKTLPYFWIGANTITFLMPGEYRIICAAFMSIFLGLILSTASKLKARAKTPKTNTAHA
ncbi:MAG: hypothetical protein AAGU27_23250 [Dehalobacterium sp.]